MQQPPTHIHCKKGDVECKFWLDRDSFDIEEAYSYGLKHSDRKEIRKIIFLHFDYICEQWDRWQEMKK